MIRSNKPFLLCFMNRNYRRVTKIYRYASYIVIAGGFFLGAGLYGATALRVALGEEAFVYYYGEDLWELAAHGMEFVSVPMTLILGTTGLFNTVTLLLPILYIPHTFRTLADPINEFQLREYPPGPLVTLLLWPYIRMGYRYVWSRLASWITAKPSQRRQRSIWDGIDLILRIQRDEDNERDGAIAPLDVNQQVEDEPEFEDLPDDEQNGGQGNEQREGGNGENRAEVIRFTEGYLLRVFLSSFFSPFLSNLLGRGLKQLSHHSPILRQFLGIDSTRSRPSGRLGMRKAGWAGLLVPMGYNIYGSREMDPVWWRNAVGISLFVVLTDATTLLHLWLAVRERRSRRIVDRDFQGVDYSGLDLIVDD
ncbi:uncharacterized protein EI90DRAFT_3056256 [Cantharellus anzutake]|uniref:uncharacterized protein n=1 Tax=Cantharellus anzutake TaxID=1750568 RepID=UPI001904FE29|nr:uncharacterized protein EI90DRAFT_3056256 [Cantharellus anzutake]KAF8332015.1 hypothetical protein EI90DRAFT_3056256 [Cantharellus anzutake]